MDGFIVGLAIAIPVVLVPAIFIWYLNTTGILTVIKETRRRRLAREKRVRATGKARSSSIKEEYGA